MTTPPSSGDREAADRPDEGALTRLREETERLVQRLPGALRRVVVRTEAGSIEIEWASAGPHPAAAPRGTSPPAPGHAPEPEQPVEVEDAAGRHVVTSPLVGTFYLGPEPGAGAFVEPGQHVGADDPVGIVEAMKLMNRIVAGVDGTVVEIAADDGEMVEFAQPLVIIEPSAT